MFAILLSIIGIHLMALITPGPDFFFISQTAARFSRKESFKAVLGITVGVMIWAGLGVLGLHFVLEKFVWLRHIIVILGALYLSYLAVQLLRSAFSKQVGAEEVSFLPEAGQHLFLKGLLTNLANPKAIAYFASVFSMFVSDGMGTETKLAIFAVVAIETLIWFCIVILVFSLPAMKRAYKKVMRVIDGVAGGIFSGFAIYFLYQEFKSFFLNQA